MAKKKVNDTQAIPGQKELKEFVEAHAMLMASLCKIYDNNPWGVGARLHGIHAALFMHETEVLQKLYQEQQEKDKKKGE